MGKRTRQICSRSGNLEGVSTLSITNGVVSTYSATTLDHTASAYYDTYTVATLFDNATAITQNQTAVTTNTTTTLSATANAWDDYDLQTDHYAVAFFVSGSNYANPLYWGDSCSAETGDCTIGAGGGFAYWVSVAYIYVGSTLADEEYIPQTATGPPIVDDSAYNSFLLEIGQTSTGQVIQVIRDWKAAIALIAGVIITAENALNPQKDDPGQNPIPYQLELVADTYENPQPGVQIRPTRLRTYFIKDTNGYNWHNDKPLTIKEQSVQFRGQAISQRHMIGSITEQAILTIWGA